MNPSDALRRTMLGIWSGALGALLVGPLAGGPSWAAVAVFFLAYVITARGR